MYDRALPRDAIFLGEVGLGGEIRPVSQGERRLAEAAKMGMSVAYMAERAIPKRAPREIRAIGVRTVTDLLQRVASYRCSRDLYKFPVEMLFTRWLMPQQRLS